MIAVTRLDGREIVVNLEHLVFVESTPDTLLRLHGGERIMVKESVAEVVRRSIEFRRLIAAGPREE